MAVVITQAGIAIPNGTIIRVTNFCYQNGQMAMPSVHYQMTSPGGVGIFNLGDAAFSFQTNFASAAKARLSTGVVLTGTKAAIVSLVNKGQPGIATDGSAGTNGTVSLPGQVTGLVHLASDLGGKKGRGRVYLPFPTVGEQDTDNTPSSVFVAGWNAWAGDISTIFTCTGPGGATMVATGVIWHKETGDYSFLNGSYVKKLYATQRRRGDYGRSNAGTIT
jgi:hypothetical protein